MKHENEPTADSPRPDGRDGNGGMHDAPTRSVAGRHSVGPGTARAPLPAGAVFGHYTIESVLGEGGMGVVYRARQERPAREVALKVIRPGLASSQAMRRFELEAEVLGRLQNPGIAQVFEAGATAEGQPFFAMELVRGESLTRYAAHHRLGTRERLELFAKVCEAVQHAHTKGVIHRDLKPVNILVDASGQPKILDFGVARVTQHDVQAVTITTDIGQIIGTVPYMSPEQIEGDPGNLDTRSDVYALGVILYELLTGRMPYDLSKKMIHEAARIIQEDEPTRLSSIDRALRGDIETIALKALEKDKARRYQAASDLGADITRFLRSEPIAARPASRSYQLRKFAKRNKALVGGVVAAFVLLAAGLAGTSYGLVAAREQRARADERAEAARLSEAAASAARDAEAARAEELKRVSDFQSQMLSQIDVTRAGKELMTDIRERFNAALEKSGSPEADRAVSVDALRQELVRVNATDIAAAMIDRTVLRPAIIAIDEQFKNDARTDASLRRALADLYQSIGLYDAALPLQESALATRRRVLGEEHVDTLTSIISIGALLSAQGKLAEAEPYYREALEKSPRVLGEEHPDTLISIGNMGVLLQSQGKLAEAEPYYREALEKRRRVLGEEHQYTLISIHNMGFLLSAQGRLAEAEPYYREALEQLRRVLGEEHPRAIKSVFSMGSLLQAQGKLAEAEPYIREAMEKSRRVLGEDHPSTLTSITNMGALLQAQGKLAEAEPYIREAMEKSPRVLGEDHPDTLTAINNMGALRYNQRKPAEAEPYFREALEKRRRVLGEEHPETLTSVSSTGTLLRAQGKLAEAEPYYREALEKRRRVLGEEHPDTLLSIGNMGVLLLAQGKLAEAEPYYREALEKSRSVLGKEHPHTLIFAGRMGVLLRLQDRLQEAIELLAPAEGATRKVFTGGNAPRLAAILVTLGRSRAALEFDAERFALAESNLLEAHAILVTTRGESHKDTIGCAQGLVELYAAWHEAEPDEEVDAKAAEWREKLDARVSGEGN